MNKTALIQGISTTLFICTVHLLLACVYRYLTLYDANSVFFDFDRWSYSFRRDVFGFNFSIAFIGIVVTFLLTAFSEPTKTEK